MLLFIIWTVEVIPQSRINGLKKSLLAVLLGIGLATRINFTLTLPLLFAVLVKITGWKSAIKYTSITFLTFCIMIIPFYLWDPQGFSPFRTVTIFGDFQTFFPFSVLIVPLISGVIALILACKLTPTYLLRNCTVALAFPVLCAIVLRSIKIGSPDFLSAEYGMSFLFFGTVAFLPMLKENNIGGTVSEKF